MTGGRPGPPGFRCPGPRPPSVLGRWPPLRAGLHRLRRATARLASELGGVRRPGDPARSEGGGPLKLRGGACRHDGWAWAADMDAAQTALG